MWKCTVVATGVGVNGIDDGDESEAGEVTVFQAVLRHVEERRMRQHTLQEDLRLELELTRKVRRDVRSNRQLSTSIQSSCERELSLLCV